MLHIKTNGRALTRMNRLPLAARIQSESAGRASVLAGLSRPGLTRQCRCLKIKLELEWAGAMRSYGFHLQVGPSVRVPDRPRARGRSRPIQA